MRLATRRFVHGANQIVDLPPVNGDRRRGRDPELDAVAAGAQHADLDAVADDDRFVALTSKDQHVKYSTDVEADTGNRAASPETRSSDED